MDYRTFGRTGLSVSVAGLGAGGASRLGLSYGSSEEEAVAVIHRALELGITYFDTAENYETEEVVGRGLAGHRDEVVLSSKVGVHLESGERRSAAALRDAVELSLKKLGTDRLDVFHLHRVSFEDYPYCVAELVPELEGLRAAGKLAFTGISESTSDDPSHEMLALAAEDDLFDVVMVGFTFFNQSARDRLLPTLIANNSGVEIMATARSQFSRPEQLAEEVLALVEQGAIDGAEVDALDPLAFLTDSGVTSVAEGSYRFSAHEPGVHVVLVGTGRIEHLEENVVSLNAGPLPPAVHDRIVRLFGHLAAAVYVPGRVSRP